WVTLALRQGECGGADFREAGPRWRLPATVLPGQDVVVEAVYQLPKDYQGKPWRLDLVNEGLYWFSARGRQPTEVNWGAGGGGRGEVKGGAGGRASGGVVRWSCFSNCWAWCSG